MELKRTQIKIEEQTIKLLKHFAVEMNTSMAQIIRWMIKGNLGLVTLHDKPFVELLELKIQRMNKLKNK